LRDFIRYKTGTQLKGLTLPGLPDKAVQTKITTRNQGG
jgi:hypothetical protein